MAPSDRLASSVVCAWSLSVRASGEPYRQRILPDGCADIIWSSHADPIVVGPMTRAAMSAVSPGTTLWGLRCRPGFAAAVIGVPAGELVDRKIPLRELWGRGGHAISEQLRNCQSLRAGVAAVEQALATRPSSIAADPVVASAVRSMGATRPIPVAQLAQRAGLTERHLRRRFAAAVGYSPKLFQRVVRFQTLLALADDPARSGSLGDLAFAAGYADQAHMTREVREFAAVTPTALVGTIASALALSGLLDARQADGER